VNLHPFPATVGAELIDASACVKIHVEGSEEEVPQNIVLAIARRWINVRVTAALNAEINTHRTWRQASPENQVPSILKSDAEANGHDNSLIELDEGLTELREHRVVTLVANTRYPGAN
jgi:hypothetical protein